MNDEQLRSRLARLDPQATAPVDPITSPQAQDLLERTMASELTTDTSTDTAGAEAPGRRCSRRGLALVSAAAAVALGVTGAVVLSQGDSAPPAKKTTLALTLPGGGDGGGTSIASCLMFSVDTLKLMPVAFAGTVSSVANDTVTLDVTNWYAGGSADVVTLANPDNTTSAALDGVTFVDGKKYLVTATDGNVNGCGYSGEATPDYEKAFTEAFPK